MASPTPPGALPPELPESPPEPTPEDKWGKARWKAEAKSLREDVENLMIQMQAQLDKPAIAVDDEQAREKIEQLKREVHNLQQGQDGRRVQKVREVLARASKAGTGVLVQELQEALR